MPWKVLLSSLLRLLFLILQGNPRARLLSELLLVRQENATLVRQGRRPRLEPGDRLILGFLAGLISRKRLPKVSAALSPGTLLRFHRALVSRKYSLLYGNKKRKPGPKGPSKDLVRFVLEAKQLNPFYGCQKIALLATHRLGTPVSEQTVRRILLKHRDRHPTSPQGPSWWTFFAQSKDSLWALDLFRVESISLQSYWVLVVMDVWSRKIIGFASCKGTVNGEVQIGDLAAYRAGILGKNEGNECCRE